MTASFGIAGCRASDTWAEWLERADTALYRAKREGRNRAQVEDLTLHAGDPSRDSVQVLQLQWDPAYETGHPAIDAQHRELFDKANALLRLGHAHGDAGLLADRVAALLEDMARHFLAEEQIIMEHGWKDMAHHREIHAQLLQRGAELLQQFREGRLGVEALYHYVVHEITAQHILLEDIKFRALFSADALV